MTFDDRQFKNSFAIKMKELMHDRGISEDHLSIKTSISQSAINRIKNAVVCPSVAQAVAIANFFELELSDFLKDVDGYNDMVSSSQYAPIVNAEKLTRYSDKEFSGFFKTETKNVVGFKFDESFECDVLSKDSIILVEKIKSLSTGDMLLFNKNNKNMVGNYIDQKVRPIHDLKVQYDISELNLLGRVISIETTYIKNPTIIEKIIDSIGKAKIEEAVDLVTSNS